MKKIQPIDETGRRMADERYGHLGMKPITDFGHSQMHRDMRKKFETPSHETDKYSGVKQNHRNHGDTRRHHEGIQRKPGPEE